MVWTSRLRPSLSHVCKLRIVRIDRCSHDADRRPAVDLLQPFENGPQECSHFSLPRMSSMARIDDGIDARLLAHPLRRDELGKRARRVIGVHLVEIGEPVAVGGVGRQGQEQAEQQGGTHGEDLRSVGDRSESSRWYRSARPESTGSAAAGGLEPAEFRSKHVIPCHSLPPGRKYGNVLIPRIRIHLFTIKSKWPPTLVVGPFGRSAHFRAAHAASLRAE